VRKGSIPMVLIVVVCLGIVAVASIFSTSSSARLDKKSELNQAAGIIAQAAVEEIIMKCSNGKAAALDGKRQTFPADVTAITVGVPPQDLQIAPVEVVTRVIEDKTKVTPGQQQAELEIRELVALVPGFFKKDNPNGVANLKGGLATAPINGVGSNVEMFYDVEWRKKMLTAPAGTFDPVLLLCINEAYRTKSGQTVTGLAFGESSLAGKAKAYYEKAVKAGGEAESDNNNNPRHDKVLDLFKKVPSLPYLPGPGGYDATNVKTLKHSPAELAAFKVDDPNSVYAKATEALADHMQSRINGCNGDFNYAIGGMLTGLGRGTPAKNDSDPGEETYRDQSEESGLTEYKEGLLTLSTKVKYTRGMASGEQQYTGHRLMRQMNLNKIMADVGKNTLAYLHGYYNLTRMDLVELGFMGTPQDETTVPTANGKTFGVMDERYSVYAGNIQVRNAQLASCLSAPK
jgi:hypothetical protein